VAVPLGVLVGLTDPHADTAQLTLQVTPWLAGSIATVAVMETVWPCWTVGGEAGELIVTVIFDGLTVTDNIPDVTTMGGFPESVAVTVNVEVADEVTKPVLNWPGFVSLGMPESNPLGLKVKPAGSDPEATLQVMVPAPPELRLNWKLKGVPVIGVGFAAFRALCMAGVEGSCGGGETTTVAEAPFMVSLTEVAVTVVVRLAETDAGAV
jgi:hypothetical protein